MALNGEYDRKSELEAFDSTKTGVKGLVDSGIQHLPRIFLHNKTDIPSDSTKPRLSHNESIPIIDLHSLHFDNATTKQSVIDSINRACEDWGFFQVINHGINVNLLDRMIHGVRAFHELDDEVKKQYYSRDESKKFKCNSNFDLYKAPVANWRDSFSCVMSPVLPLPQDLPHVCRDVIYEFAKEVKKLGGALLGLFSQALGLDAEYLKEMEVDKGLFVLGHYYPACPKPELAIGTSSHADADFFTVLLQDGVGGLQILHDNKWVDVPPCHGALVINIGDLLQLITNDRFKSVNHRVVALETGPRISTACFFRTHFETPEKSKVYGPIKELVSEEKPPVYKQTTITEYVSYYYNKGMDGTSALPQFRLQHPQ